jgi:hypothetical protein
VEEDVKLKLNDDGSVTLPGGRLTKDFVDQIRALPNLPKRSGWWEVKVTSEVDQSEGRLVVEPLMFLGTTPTLNGRNPYFEDAGEHLVAEGNRHVVIWGSF